MNKPLFFYKEELYAPETSTPAETRERPPTLDLPKCQCRCCGCVCVSSRGQETRVDPFGQDVDPTLYCSNASDDSDERYSDRIAAQEGVECHIEDLHSDPWIEVVLARLAGYERPGSPEVHEPMDGTLAPPSTPETPGLGSPESMYDSMYNEANSDSRSMTNSTTYSIYDVLHHSGLLTSVGAAFGEQRYIFTAEPLRLSYEQEHCRNTTIGVYGPNDDAESEII